MTIKLQDAELKVMDVIWRRGEVSAKAISMDLTERYGWKKNTTYTLIKRCIDNGAIERIEPNFICRALIPREEIQKAETNELINKIYYNHNMEVYHEKNNFHFFCDRSTRFINGMQ